jgi:hypothetical protein
MPNMFCASRLTSAPETEIGSGAPLAAVDRGPLLPDPKVGERYGVTSMTLWRWDRCPELAFPAAVVISGRKYRYLQELIEWELRCTKASASALAERRRPIAADTCTPARRVERDA